MRQPKTNTIEGAQAPLRRLALRAALCATTAILCAASPAIAQTASGDSTKTADAKTQDSAASVTDIVVTGTRVARPGFESPTPVTTLSSADLNRVAAANIADAINQLPAVKASLTPSSATNSAVFAGGNYLDLRGLGYLRTLTLLDGQRIVPSTSTGGVNINAIPQALIQSVDIVTGGASAAYGSDAVAGVVNLRLNNKLEGVQGELQGGITDHNDNRNFLASVAFGTSFADGRGHLLVGAEAAENSGIGRVGDRDWGNAPGVIVNPAYNGGSNGQPLYLISGDARSSNVGYGGVINSPGLLKGIQFGPGGTTLPFKYGNSVTATTMDGGDGYAYERDLVLETPIKRYSTLARLSYDISNNISAYAQFNYAYSHFDENSIAGVEQITIKADNAYLPASIRSVMTANNIPSFVMGRTLDDYARGRIIQTNNSYQGTIGAKAKLGGSWTLDAFYSYGKTLNDLAITGNRITARFNQAVDAVVNPQTGGIVCRSTLTDPTNGCVPLNLFGVGSPSAQASAWIAGTALRNVAYEQQEGSITLRGDPFSTWAGPVSVAFGGEWRRQTVNVTSDPLSMANAFRLLNAQPFSGAVTVKEGFAEAVVPLAKDASWAKALDLDLAGRVTDYSTAGTVETWKAGLDYRVNSSIRFRATRSRDIRAPSLDELFTAGTSTVAIVTDPTNGQAVTIAQRNGGNPNLKPEKADTLTVGFVLTPSFIPRLSVSVDYYDINLKGAINTLTASAIVTRCYTDTPSACSLITRTNGVITSVLSAPVNFQKIETSGVDFELSYRIPMRSNAIDLHGLVNYTDKLSLTDGPTTTNYAGSTEQFVINGIGGTPHWRANASATFIADRFQASVTGRYVGGGVLSRTTLYLGNASVNGVFYLDLSGQFDLFKTSRGKVSLFAGITNVTDKAPPVTAINDYVTTRSLYDVIGRSYTIGIRFHL